MLASLVLWVSLLSFVFVSVVGLACLVDMVCLVNCSLKRQNSNQKSKQMHLNITKVLLPATVFDFNNFINFINPTFFLGQNCNLSNFLSATRCRLFHLGGSWRNRSSVGTIKLILQFEKSCLGVQPRRSQWYKATTNHQNQIWAYAIWTCKSQNWCRPNCLPTFRKHSFD